MRISKFKTFFSLLCVTLIAVPGASAQESSSSIVKKVVIEGNITTSDNVILSKIKTRPDQTFSRKTANEDLRRLYELGFFSQISIDVEDFAGGLKVTYLVKEKPVVKEIVFKGNRHMSPKKLKKEIKTKVGEVLDEKQLKQDQLAVIDKYEAKGYQRAEVNTEVSIDERSGQAIVYFRITENFKTKIKAIHITGNKGIETKKILKLIKTKPKGWFSFGILKEDKFEEDLERVEAYYKSQGYLDFKITDVKKELADEGKWLTITIDLSEGDQYKIQSISVEGVEDFPETEVAGLVKVQPGEVYYPDKLRKDLESIRKFYLARGYIDVRVRGRTNVAGEPGTLVVVVDIKENEIFHVEKIEIQGNARTKDKVIRRELNVQPGQIFNGVKVERSQERLQNLGYFKEVDFSIQPSDKAGSKNLVIKVQEQKTGELGFGAGFSSIDDFIGFVDLRQNNFDIADFPYFTGAGQKFRLRAELGNKRRDFILSFTEPFLFDRKLAFGVDGFSRRREFLSRDYDEDRRGGGVRLGVPLGEFMRADFKYTLEDVEIFGVDADASDFIQSQEGDSLVSRVATTLTRDTRNSVLLPSRGSRTSLTGEFAGLGGDTDFAKVFGSSAVFFPLFRGHILMLKGSGGISEGFSDTEVVPIFDRYFLGGANTIRGFDFRDVGPRDENDEPIGGEAFIAGTVEYTFPIIPRLRGATFFDVGNVYFDRDDFDLNDLSGSVGIGVRVTLPIGPVKVDYGWPVITDEFTDGENGRFSFNVGTAF